MLPAPVGLGSISPSTPPIKIQINILAIYVARGIASCLRRRNAFLASATYWAIEEEGTIELSCVTSCVLLIAGSKIFCCICSFYAPMCLRLIQVLTGIFIITSIPLRGRRLAAACACARDPPFPTRVNWVVHPPIVIIRQISNK